jgi:hypothetical protein
MQFPNLFIDIEPGRHTVLRQVMHRSVRLLKLGTQYSKSGRDASRKLKVLQIAVNSIVRLRPDDGDMALGNTLLVATPLSIKPNEVLDIEIKNTSTVRINVMVMFEVPEIDRTVSP